MTQINDLAMLDAELLFELPLAERDAELAQVRRGPSTPDTKARYAFLRSKRVGDTWQEGRFLFRRGLTGTTVLDFDRLTGPSGPFLMEQ